MHAELPHHLYVNINNAALGPKMPKGTTKGIWHGVYARPGQLLLAHVILESGAHWSGLPLHHISTSDSFTLDPHQLMPWYAMGSQIETINFTCLQGLPAKTRKPISANGTHTGIVIDWNDGYSQYPAEHKPLSLINLDSGQFALLPNNYFTVTDKHFTNNDRKGDLVLYQRNERTYWENMG